MKKIAITGGKGGVGKSTISVWLLNKLVDQEKKVILIDADVEGPNDHLLVGQKLENVVEKVYFSFPKIDKNKCRKCGLCVQKCQSHALFQPKDGYPVLIKDLCSGCGLCWHLCPYGAITPQKEPVANIYENQLGSNAWLITADTIGVIEETGPIVRQLKEFGLKRAKEQKSDYVLIDTAPGIHCSVIQALWGVDQAYAVTEPTPLGAHDLRLILKLTRKLGIPTKVILNQADLGKKRLIDKIITKFGVKIKKEMPYSQTIAQKYSKGELYPFPD